MSDLIIILLIIVVTILFLLEVYAPPRREHNPNEPKYEAIMEHRHARQVQRTSPLKAFRSFLAALFGGDDPVKTFESEPILHRTGRHWIVLLIRGFVPLLIALLAGALAFYRFIGGTFIRPGVRRAGQFTVVEFILVALIVVVLFFWQRSVSIRTKDKKKPTLGIGFLPNLPYFFGVGLLGLMLFFRLQGGEVFYIEPFSLPQNDLFNQLLLLFSFISLIVLVYIAIDWSNDFLILTPTRVIFEDTELLVRQIQQEIVIENIQQVNVRADSYLAYLLGYVRNWIQRLQRRLGFRSKPAETPQAVYAKIIIGSYSPQTLIFEYANQPYEMQSKIQGVVNNLRKQQDVDILRRLIENQVYENKPPKSDTPQVEVDVSESGGLLGWFRHPNPEVRKEGEFDVLTWRPVKLFILFAIARPFFSFLLPALALWFLVRLGLFVPELALLIALLIALVTLAWGLWIREEHENDKFILNIREIVDVDKKPFGPESSRRAPLSAIQNIEFDVSFIESILRYGDVLITTAGGAGKFTFEHVPDPRGVQATINNYLSYFKRRETERNLKGTLDLLQQYHKLQIEHGELINSDLITNEMVLDLISRQVEAQLAADLPAQVEREVAEQVPQEIGRRVVKPLRRELGRTGFFRRRRLR
jgi:PH (Pleckstrin Homology) domain-containing protein